MKKDIIGFAGRARRLREVIRHYDTRAPIEYMIKGSVQYDGTIRVPKRIVQKHIKAGHLDPVCFFLIQDGSVLVMEKGLAEERIGRDFGELLSREN